MTINHSPIKVLTLKSLPDFKNPYMQSGIRTRDEAERWAIKHGHSVVYFFEKRQRVYAERSNKPAEGEK